MPEQFAPTRTDSEPTPAGSVGSADTDARLTAELASVLSGARRRALRDGDTQVDTAHLLHSLLEADPEVRAAFDGGHQVARVLGYLVQRSIGYGLRWQGTVEDSGAVPTVRDRAVPGWSPPTVIALTAAMERAARRGDLRAAWARSARRTRRRPGVPGGRGARTGRSGRAVAGGSADLSVPTGVTGLSSTGVTGVTLLSRAVMMTP